MNHLFVRFGILAVFTLLFQSALAGCPAPEEEETPRLPVGNYKCTGVTGTRMRPEYLIVMSAAKQQAMILSILPFREWQMEYPLATATISADGASLRVDGRESRQIDWSSADNENLCFKRIKDSTHITLKQTATGIEGEMTSYPDFIVNPNRPRCSTPDLALAKPVKLECQLY
jgi:hypothetical protein